MLDLISSKPKMRLLRYLSTHSGEFTGRQLARAAHVDFKGAALALADLTRLGVVGRRRVGRAYYYRLNTSNYLVSQVLAPAFRRDAHWQEDLGKLIAATLDGLTESVILYGSVAKGRAGPQSDIDLLIVVQSKASAPKVERLLEAQRVPLSERFGRSLSFLVITKVKFRERLRRGDPFIMEVAEQGRVLAGSSLASLAAHA